MDITLRTPSFFINHPYHIGHSPCPLASGGSWNVKITEPSLPIPKIASLRSYLGGGTGHVMQNPK